jgi:hypothetical protein
MYSDKHLEISTEISNKPEPPIEQSKSAFEREFDEYSKDQQKEIIKLGLKCYKNMHKTIEDVGLDESIKAKNKEIKKIKDKYENIRKELKEKESEHKKETNEIKKKYKKDTKDLKQEIAEIENDMKEELIKAKKEYEKKKLKEIQEEFEGKIKRIVEDKNVLAEKNNKQNEIIIERENNVRKEKDIEIFNIRTQSQNTLKTKEEKHEKHIQNIEAKYEKQIETIKKEQEKEKLKYEEHTQKFMEYMNKDTVRKQNSSFKGQDGEKIGQYITEEIFNELNGESDDVHTTAKSGDAVVKIVGNQYLHTPHKIMIEYKNHDTNIKKKELEKTKRDMLQHPEYDMAIMMALKDVKIANKNKGLDIEIMDDGRPIVCITNVKNDHYILKHAYIIALVFLKNKDVAIKEGYKNDILLKCKALSSFITKMKNTTNKRYKEDKEIIKDMEIQMNNITILFN